MEKIVWLTGMPRSGTNWFSQIFASHPDVRMKFCPLFSYEFKNAADENSSPEAWRALLDQVYRTPGEYLDQEYLRRDGLVPKFAEHRAEPSVLAIKSTRYHHLTAGLLEKCPEIRFVGIVRNPCASIHSWLTNPLEFPKEADPATEWRTGACRKTAPEEFWGFDDWKRVTALFLEWEKRFPDRFRIARYETFVKDAPARVKELFGWLGLDFPAQTETFLSESHSRHDTRNRSVFKAPAATERWRSELDPNIAATIAAELQGTPLAQFLA